ncbi:hypothetical protein HYPSUDRAFT_203242 [Hypholoma sublateritium FD-334 SS-4]|uniref:Uncharacterized protein n=1 Tax=Hypholoma sublateritium (strain FD-334 SS-4) TaxID=945553 RepID=A0A0D2NX29_HYPSF|nr:hypothetical protein HYPSUDRAFT_203242 [Hypholoma sublateritium FD-334 SS-4]
MPQVTVPSKRKRVLPASWNSSAPEEHSASEDRSPSTSPVSPEPPAHNGLRQLSILAPGLKLIDAPSFHKETAYGQWIKKGLRTKRVVTPEGVKGSATDPTYLLTSNQVRCALSVLTDPPGNRTFPPARKPYLGETLIPGGTWDMLDEETKFFLVLQVELPREAAFSRIFENCPAVTLTTFQGARVTREAPDWIQFAWDGLVFWQPRTLILELVSSAARLERDTDLRNRLYDWTRCVSRVTLDAVHPPYPTGKNRPPYLRHIDSPDGSYMEPDEQRSSLLRDNYNQITKQKRLTGARWV